jgi:hypothetical protein
LSVSSSLLDGYDDPEILPYSIPESCLMGADGAQIELPESLNSPLSTMPFRNIIFQGAYLRPLKKTL